MKAIIISFAIAICITYTIVGITEINKREFEWNAFLEANNCVELKTAPTLRETKCYICGDGITYCK